MAWRCTRTELGSFLEHVGADRDDQGRFLLAWSQGRPAPTGSRPGGEVPLIISDDVRYRIRGAWAPLAHALRRRAPADTLKLWDKEAS